MENDIAIRPAKRQEIARVLVVDDELVLLKALRQLLEAAGHEVVTCDKPLEVQALCASQTFHAALVDLRMPELSGLQLLEKLKQTHPEIELVMMTAYGTVEDAFRALRLGAYDFLKKPFENIDEVAHVVSQAIERRRLMDRNRFLEQQIDLSARFENIIGRSPAMRQVFELVESAAPSGASILIEGESGTGKELIARAIHRRSDRANKSMISVHCGAIAETLLESEMFGHVRGAFTGANQTRKGYFEVADGGTIFLDEIGEMSLATQVKLLRVLQEGEIMRVGASEVHRVDVRAIAATNVDLRAAKTSGRFREDLFYRLNVISICLPPLRERREDIPIIAQHFLDKYLQKSGKNLSGFSAQCVDLLLAHHWPGNVRELENVIEAAVVLSRQDSIEPKDLRIEPKQVDLVRPAAAPIPTSAKDLLSRSFAEAKTLAIEGFERSYVDAMLDETAGNISEAARRSGLDRSNFRRVMSRYREV